MATKGKKSPSEQAGNTNVTRIKASDDKPAAKHAKEQPKPRTNPLVSIGRYFTGAWYELRQVRWPNRKATWSLTFAMLVFTAFFVVLILLLDALFKYLFELILG